MVVLKGTPGQVFHDYEAERAVLVEAPVFERVRVNFVRQVMGVQQDFVAVGGAAPKNAPKTVYMLETKVISGCVLQQHFGSEYGFLHLPPLGVAQPSARPMQFLLHIPAGKTSNARVRSICMRTKRLHSLALAQRLVP